MDNKKALDKVSIIRSKGLKNEIAGFITKFLKKEKRDKEIQEELIANQAKITEEENTESSVDAGAESSPILEEKIIKEPSE